MMLFSIIIPAYNCEHTIGNTLDSILNQSYQNFELIIVNDGSTDKTIERLSEYKDERIKVVSQKNQRQGAARNYGLRLAKGDYTVFVDADDSIDSDLLKKIALKLEHSPTKSDMVFYDLTRVYPNSAKIIPFDRSLIEKVKNQEKARIVGIASPCVAAYSSVFLKKNKILFLEQVFFEDIAFMVETMFHAKEIDYVENVYYNYNIMEVSTVRSFSPKVNKDVLSVLEYCHDFLSDKGDYQEEFEYLVKKYLLFEASIRVVDTKSPFQERKELLKDFNNFYKIIKSDNSNYLYKKEGILFKSVVTFSKKENFLLLNAVNFIRKIKNCVSQ